MVGRRWWRCRLRRFGQVQAGGVVPGVLPGVDECVVLALGEVDVGEAGGSAVGGGDVVAVEFGDKGFVAVDVVAVCGDDVEPVVVGAGGQRVWCPVDPGSGAGRAPAVSLSDGA